MIIIVQMVKVASEVIIRRRISASAIRTYIRNIVVFVFFLGVLPTVVAHPACRAHQHLLDPEPCHFQQLHLLNLHHSNIQPQHPQFHLHHLSLALVHHECAYTQLQLPQDNPSLLYHPAFHLHNRHQVHRHSHLTLPQSHFHLQPHLRVYQHHMASTSTITPCSTHHHHNDLMTTTPLSESKTSQGIFHTQTQRRAESTSRSRGHQQWLASQHCLLPSRHRSRELTSANGFTHREADEFTSMNSGKPSDGSKADIRRMEIDIKKSSLQ